MPSDTVVPPEWVVLPVRAAVPAPVLVRVPVPQMATAGTAAGGHGDLDLRSCS